MSGSDAEKSTAVPGIGRRILGAVGALGVLAGVIVGASVALQTLYAAAEAGDGRTPAAPLPVSVSKLKVVEAYEIEEWFVGRIEPARETALGFEIAGAVVSVLVDEGDRVKAGRPLAQLDTETLKARKAQLLAEKAKLEADLALAERTLARQEKLSGRGFATDQKTDEARTAKKTTIAGLAANKAQLRLVDLDISKATILAPFNGVIAERSIDPGAIVSAGQRVVRILEAGRPIARVGLPPARAAILRVGDAFPIKVGDILLPAKLTAIRPDLDPATRTVSALFEIDLGAAAAARVSRPSKRPASSPSFLAPAGEIARLALPSRVQAKGAWAPLSALQEDAKGLWRILLLGRDEEGAAIATGQSVEVLHVKGERAFISGALKDGADFIPEGVNRVSIGDKVSPSPAAD
ncbi:MAG: efflux RND transporter periplasmic adaptor subunit [Neomegalonema sp.]|nr:efflux RND transporter periplasmic adaptor subunit [Neomegalonema sp.]